MKETFLFCVADVCSIDHKLLVNFNPIIGYIDQHSLNTIWNREYLNTDSNETKNNFEKILKVDEKFLLLTICKHRVIVKYFIVCFSAYSPICASVEVRNKLYAETSLELY